MFHNAPVTRDHRLQQRAPAVSAMDVARPQHTPFDVAELVEYEQRMIAEAMGRSAKMGGTIVSAGNR